MGTGEPSSAPLREVAGKPLIGYVLDRLAKVDKLAGVIVATTPMASDDSIQNYCRSRATRCFRGERDDVLGRILAALKAVEAKAGLVVHPEGPLIDPAIIDHVANLIEMTDGMVDWVGNTLSRTYPHGMEVEAFTVAALEEASRRCDDPTQRRQGLHFLRQNSRFYRLLSITAPAELHRPEVGLHAVKNMPAIEAVVDYFGGGTDVTLGDMIAFLDANPDATRPA
jgi:spore coat polysaccharide biosynthesis protein SpsF